MSENTRQDIRKLLKTFGIQADEAMIAHIARNPGSTPLHLRITLQDVTDYGDTPPDEVLYLEIEADISR